MDDSILDTSFCSEISFCMSEPDENPQSIHVDLSNGSPLNDKDVPESKIFSFQMGSS